MRPRTPLPLLLVLPLVPLLFPGPAAAQSATRLHAWAGSGWSGRMVDISGHRLGSGVPPQARRVVNLALTAAPALAAGLTLERDRGGHSLRAGLALTRTEFDLAGFSAVPGDSTSRGESLVGIRTTGGVGQLTATTGSVDLLLGVGAGRAVTPYLVLGLAATLDRLSELDEIQRMEPFTGVELTSRASRWALELGAVIGVGAETHLDSRHTLRLELTDRFGSNPWSSQEFRAVDFFGGAEADLVVQQLRLSLGLGRRF